MKFPFHLEHPHYHINHLLSLIQIIVQNSGHEAGMEVTVEHQGANLLQCSLNGINLVNDIETIEIILNHPGYAFDVTLNTS
jgi:hypothetical protein